jgi:hypothetical protein
MKWPFLSWDSFLGSCEQQYFLCWVLAVVIAENRFFLVSIQNARFLCSDGFQLIPGPRNACMIAGLCFRVALRLAFWLQFRGFSYTFCLFYLTSDYPIPKAGYSMK